MAFGIADILYKFPEICANSGFSTREISRFGRIYGNINRMDPVCFVAKQGVGSCGGQWLLLGYDGIFQLANTLDFHAQDIAVAEKYLGGSAHAHSGRCAGQDNTPGVKGHAA